MSQVVYTKTIFKKLPVTNLINTINNIETGRNVQKVSRMFPRVINWNSTIHCTHGVDQ